MAKKVKVDYDFAKAEPAHGSDIEKEEAQKC